MRQYELYIFEESVAHQYYGQESKLFYLFLDYENASPIKKEVIRKQIEYITKPIPTLFVQQKIKQAFKQNQQYENHKQTNVITLNSGAQAELVIDSQSIHVTANGTPEVEMMFFEVLRSCAPTFFAFSIEEYRYGWLKPIQQLKRSQPL
ncbi:sporulation inhibitor of replication protein SirA [Halalkalibacter sp. APA_J-10(15)]|uniref:sporulation inhibitor of replication protein SirA n=1 Tax=Halalkalibacter sp. APA_J-10(15) TaxID=2933805 RepID=UPI001FF0E203|nr:sporulation inhibitor of replication protein SirA [Halalkalibacter sp. APA_J-10(15)]MCK0470856.1 sporulation inhibitor of replication protein SirA [Halalkalibacter sp. APA_J-10(15)]